MFWVSKIRSHGQSGLTLVEMMVVIVIIVILVGIALMQRGSADQQLKRQNVAIQLKNAFERARFDSVKRRAQSSPDVRAAVAVGPASYSLTTYKIDPSGTASAETTTFSTTEQNVVMANANGLSLPFMLYYNQRGEAVDISGNSISPAFYVCSPSCTGFYDNSSANLLVVTPTGTVNLLPGSATVPTFTTPPVTNVPTTNDIRGIVQVP